MAELIMQEEGSNPATPTSGKWKLFFKADGIYIMEDTGTVTGPFAAPANRMVSNTTALTTTEGFLRWDSTRKHVILYDGQRERGITPVGWLPYAMMQGVVPTNAFASSITLAANGGSVAIPMMLNAPMLLERVSLRNNDTATARTWGWDLYEQYANNGNGSENTLTRRAACSANDTFTPGAASNRTLTASSAPVFLAPGLFWLVIQCRHASNNFALACNAAGVFSANMAQTKTTTNPNGSTLDFVAATWTKIADLPAARLNGRVFGQTSAF